MQAALKKTKKKPNVATRFWHYSQNNSGGYFLGPTDVIVEATSSDDADERASASGLVDFGAEYCECCGSRWSFAFMDDGDPEPMIHSTPIEKVSKDYFRERATVVYMDGSTREYVFKGK